MGDKIKVLITVPFKEQLVQGFRDAAPGFEILHRPARNYTDIVAEVWADVEVLYTFNVFPPADAMPKLKWLQTHSAGVDNILPQPIVQNHPDLIITTTRGIHATNMAELVLGFLLMFGHRIPNMMEAQRRKEWADNRHEKFLPLELRTATVGIVGYGAIGREIARLVKVFGGRVLAAKRDAKTPEDREHFAFEGTGDPEGLMFDRLYPSRALPTMVKECDFLVVTVPLTESTQGLIGERIFRAMKPGSYLINVGRGGVVDEAALLEVLKSGHLAGAAMDVFAEEPLPESSPLWTAPNLIITPHIAGNTADYHDKAAAVFEENLRRYAEGNPLLNLVDRKAGY
jgi:phosphoglycerate dehydrogenase-like enzyme